MSEVYQTVDAALDNLNQKQKVHEQIEILNKKDISIVAEILDLKITNEEQKEEIDKLTLDNDKQTDALETILKILQNAAFENDDLAVRKALTHILEIAEALTV